MSSTAQYRLIAQCIQARDPLRLAGWIECMESDGEKLGLTPEESALVAIAKVELAKLEAQ